jgi:hypothetical protein
MCRCMRTTLTLDDDIAAQIKRLRRERDANLKDIVNEALRRGLRDMAGPPKKRRPFQTQAHAMGPPHIDIDNVAEALAHAEGDAYK